MTETQAKYEWETESESIKRVKRERKEAPLYNIDQLKSAWKLYNTEKIIRVRIGGVWSRHSGEAGSIQASAAERITLASWYRDKGGFPAYLENE